ncbi:four-jointed box protein 1 [Sceloporus undulatus]|uniref:four-jointed box protein 1 n=1 Tax=Sceloporus undulatus TaxID=8520 RepID=UPI001C4B4C91|nr:four-jointed box protein 1 [Sceloporus undulatus]
MPRVVGSALAGLGLVLLLGWASLAGLRSKAGLLEEERAPQPSRPGTLRALLTVPQEPSPAEGPPSPPPPPPSVRGGVFWSRALEAQVPRGFSRASSAAWLRAARGSRVLSLERGGCGRSSNRLALLSDGSRACVRYGINPEQILGEALSYHLAGLLGIQERLPPLALSRVGARQWALVGEELRGSPWAEGAVVSLARWVENLTEVVAPAPWRASGAPLLPGLGPGALAGLGRAQLVELVQWSDLILFDYLTGNFDRLASNLFSLQWDPRVMHRATRNLLRGPDGGLVFLDNEAGLLHGYRLLSAWEPYHEPLLRSLCLFRQDTARALRALHRRRDAARQLRARYRAHEPLAPSLGFLSPEQGRLLQERVDRVHRHILHCRAGARAKQTGQGDAL